ncbi:MAG: RidA family protein [Luteitalea sp.]|nr:RidA family protein [Luteitalea sp.]
MKSPRFVSRCLLFAALLLPLIMTSSLSAAGVRLRSIGSDPASGAAHAVVVEEGALVHTAMMFPEDSTGRLQGEGDAQAQAIRALANIESALRVARTDLDSLVRLHIYVADASVTPLIDRLLRQRLRGKTAPALTVVETEMPRPRVLVSMDAIAATSWRPDPGPPVRLAVGALPRRTERASHVAIQPEGPFVIVSGRSASGDFEAAVPETMAQLRADLEGVGLTFDDVVQVKSFLGDMSQTERLEQMLADFFEGERVPPQVVTEWRQDSARVEIELIATTARPGNSGERVEYVEPVSARFSRVARVNDGHPVFTSGLYGTSKDPVDQVREMFAKLQSLMKEAGSDMRHLVKATYYVSDSSADEEINAIRPTLYDPQRPPAASKLSVRGTGRNGKGSTLDMIAVTVK